MSIDSISAPFVLGHGDAILCRPPAASSASVAESDLVGEGMVMIGHYVPA